VLLKVGREFEDVFLMLGGWYEWHWIGSTDIIMYDSIVSTDKVGMFDKIKA
jgi:hypothetical protein